MIDPAQVPVRMVWQRDPRRQRQQPTQVVGVAPDPGQRVHLEKGQRHLIPSLGRPGNKSPGWQFDSVGRGVN